MNPSQQKAAVEKGKKEKNLSTAIETSSSFRSGNKKKRKRNRVGSEPSFCDATGSIVTSAFAAARLEELQAMYHHHFSNINNNNKNNPKQMLSMTAQDKESVELVAANSSDSLVGRYASLGCQTSSRHLRRRVTSHNPSQRRRHRYPNHNNNEDILQKQMNPGVISTVSRRAFRSKKGLLQKAHEHWRKAATSTTTTATTNLNWLATHYWHAKRFHMETLWGWKVPLLHTNRGAKAALRLVREQHSVLHDVTWRMQPLVIVVDDTRSLDHCQNRLATIIPNFSLHSTPLNHNCWPLTQLENHNTITCTGQGMWYSPNRAPMDPIGTVSWFITHSQQKAPWICPFSFSTFSKHRTIHNSHGDDDDDADKSNSNPEEKVKALICLFVHPAIRETCCQCLQHILPPDMSSTTLSGGLAYFSLRGRSAIHSLVQTLAKFLPTSGDHVAFLQNLKTAWEEGKITTLDALSGPDQSPSKSVPQPHYGLTVIPVSPRDQGYCCNWGVCGLDLLLDPDFASVLWNALVRIGCACPIGLTDESHLCLESNPPIPVFPRDFPDLQVGRDYWSPSTPENPWNIVRHYYEGGLGRISPPPSWEKNLTCARVDWKKLVFTHVPKSCVDASTTEDLVPIMIRGAFGKPITDLLCSTNLKNRAKECNQRAQLVRVGDGSDFGGSHSAHGEDDNAENDNDSNNPPKRRCRRPSKNPTDLVHVPPPRRDEIQQFQEKCQSLRQSLSLPAVMMAHVRVEQGGILSPGETLYSANTNRASENETLNSLSTLGYITCGVFSHSRGRCHGLAVVAVSRTVEALQVAHENQALAQSREFGSTHNRFKAWICQRSKWLSVSLELIC